MATKGLLTQLVTNCIAQVPAPFFVATIDAKMIDQKHMESRHNVHCERVCQHLVTFSEQMDQWKNFHEKVKLSLQLICHLQNVKVFPTKTCDELNRAIGLMSPVLS